MGGPLSPFDTLADGRPVYRVVLAAGDLTVALLSHGARVQDVRLAGIDRSLTLGAPTLAPYLGPAAHFGAICGPVANRVAGATAELDGEQLHFDRDTDGPHLLHGGRAATHTQLWSIEAASAASASFALELPHGAGGFPGQRKVIARYTVTPPARLQLDILATTDRPTFLNFANHSYWTLAGSGTDGLRLTCLADRYLPIDEDALPSGAIAPVDGTIFDFRTGRDIRPEDRIDHSLVLSDHALPPRPVATLAGAAVALDLATTERALQVYDGRALAPMAGHDGRGYGPRAGLALEPQGWPAAPSYRHFPSIRHDVDSPYRQSSSWTFRRTA